MPVLEAEGRPFSDVDAVGLVIRRTQSGGLHSGILYRLPGGEPRILHLAFHYDLRDDPAALPYRWARLALDEVNKDILAEFVARVAGQQPLIAYGFNSEGIAIDPDTGAILPPPAGHGLTCATFIAAVLKAHGYDLVDLDTWPDRNEDIEFQAQIVELLRPNASVEHVDAVENDIGAKRLRPDEVVGAGTIPDDQWAVDFLVARQRADQVQQDLPL